MTHAVDVVAANLAAYNARDLERFVPCFDPEIEMTDLRSGAVMRGIAAVRERYRALFDASPELHSRILHRSVLDDLVCDHELVTGRSGGDVEILITYQVAGERIRRVWFARSPVAGPHIVRATAPDLDALVALGRTTYEEHFSAIWSRAAMERFLDAEFDRAAVASELAGSSVIYLLALTGGAAGFAKLRLSRTVPGDARVGAELQKIYLRRSAAGQGIGAALLAAALTEAAAHRQPVVWLDVLRTNPGAVRFYQRHGFEIAGELPFATDLAEHGMWVMVNPLAGSAPVAARP